MNTSTFKILFYLVVVFLCRPVFSKSFLDLKSSQNQPEQIEAQSVQNQEKEPARIFIYEDSYLLFGWDSSPLNKDATFKFQISAKINLVNKNLYLAYSQRSFMDLLQKSFPFYDHNFRPEVFYVFKFSDRVFLKQLQIGVFHESNGREEPQSRGWNQVYLEPFYRWDNYELSVRGWLPFLVEDENKDIGNFYGYARLRLARFWENGAKVSLMGRVGGKLNRGAIQADLALPWKSVFGTKNLSQKNSLWFQAWHGYGETLLGYRIRSTSVGVGIGIQQ